MPNHLFVAAFFDETCMKASKWYHRWDFYCQKHESLPNKNTKCIRQIWLVKYEVKAFDSQAKLKCFTYFWEFETRNHNEMPSDFSMPHERKKLSQSRHQHFQHHIEIEIFVNTTESFKYMSFICNLLFIGRRWAATMLQVKRNNTL